MILNPLRSVVSNHLLQGVSLDRVKSQLKILDTDDDVLLVQYIEAATSYAEEWMGRFILPATVEALFNSCCHCSYKKFRLSKRVFNSIVKVEVLQDALYVELTSSQYVLTQETWESFICIDDDVTIDCTIENGCQTIPETVKITYKTGEFVDISIASITSAAGTPNIATVSTGANVHGMKTGDMVLQSLTGNDIYDGLHGVIVVSPVIYTFTYGGTAQAAVVTGTATTLQTPPQIELAIMQMVARMYENRGDCCDECGNVPCAAQKLLKQYRRYIVRGANSDCCCW